MVEFKVQVEESIVQTLGYQAVERQLQEFMQQIALKMAAQEILSDLQTIDLENDPEWQVARGLAWEQEKNKYAA